MEKHNGKWLKEMGDGAMAQFSTALDAVNCSIEIQEVARAKLDGKLRIEIHSGDITIISVLLLKSNELLQFSFKDFGQNSSSEFFIPLAYKFKNHILKSYLMELFYDYWTGTMYQVLESLNRSLGQYERHYRKVKIGVTNDPERRKNAHNRSKIQWHYMVVKYKTTSINFVTKLEIILVDHHWEYIANEIGGGGGPAGPGNQYLYVLLKK